MLKEEAEKFAAIFSLEGFQCYNDWMKQFILDWMKQFILDNFINRLCAMMSS